MHFNISDTPLSISVREQAQRMENVIWMNDHVCVCVCVCVCIIHSVLQSFQYWPYKKNKLLRILETSENST